MRPGVGDRVVYTEHQTGDGRMHEHKEAPVRGLVLDRGPADQPQSWWVMPTGGGSAVVVRTCRMTFAKTA